MERHSVSGFSGVSYTSRKPMVDATPGDEFPPIEFTVTEEMVERRCFANDDYNPWYLKDSPFGGRICPPAVITIEEVRSFHSEYGNLPGGNVNATQEFHFINPLKIGKKVTMYGKLVDRYKKRGRDYFVSEYTVIDEDGLEIMRMRRERASLRKSEGFLKG